MAAPAGQGTEGTEVVGSDRIHQRNQDVEVVEGNGFLYNLRLNAKVDGSPSVVYNVLTDPNAVDVFRGIKACTFRKVLEESPTKQQRKLEVAHRALARFLFISVTFETRLFVWEDDKEHTIRFCNAREGFMKKFEGSWAIKPHAEAHEGLRHKLHNPFTAWHSKLGLQPQESTASLVTLEQALLPRAPAPPGVKGLIRRLCAKQITDMMDDLRAEVERREGRGKPKKGKGKSAKSAAAVAAAAAASMTLARPPGSLWDSVQPLINLTIQLCGHTSPSPGTALHIARSVAKAGVQPIQTVKSVSELTKYKGVLLDQFGVLHDGRQPYGPATLAAVKHLAEAGLKCFIISNSSRRSTGTIKKLEKMGFQAAWFSGAVTSGDLADSHLRERPDAWWQRLGSRCLHLTWSSRGTISLEGLGLQVTADPSTADFILAHGTEAIGQPHGPATDASLEHMRVLLQQCAARSLPMVVANPDLVTVDGPGRLAVMPGTLAKWYSEEMGGEVRLMGKPAPVIYEAAMKALGLDTSQVLAIGDSLEHDIAGASAAGIDSLFIAGGIHAEQLRVQQGASCNMQALEQLCETMGASPTYALTYLE